jgi:hypothetical protein
LLLFSFVLFLHKNKRSKPDVMKNLKWMALWLLALPLVTNTKASNCVAMQKAACTVAKVQPAHAPATLIEQILFPHGI